jgi:hypothetical protein
VQELVGVRDECQTASRKLEELVLEFSSVKFVEEFSEGSRRRVQSRLVRLFSICAINPCYEMDSEYWRSGEENWLCVMTSLYVW